MANIGISDLKPIDYDLLSDSESYMMALSEDELGIVAGGEFDIYSSKTLIFLLLYKFFV